MDKQADWTVVVADDHPLVRAAIVEALRSDCVLVVAEAGTGNEALPLTVSGARTTKGLGPSDR